MLIDQLRSLAKPNTFESNGDKAQFGAAGALSFLTHGNSAGQLGMVHSARSDSMDTGAGPLETNTSFALSQLPALRTALAELRPRLAALEASSTTPAPESNAARERRLYVETQSRKASERQGMGVGDSSADSLGRAVAPEELASLEIIAGGINRNNEDRMEE